jgi:hypothetical protein
MELWIDSDRPTLNPVTGAFLPGHVPFNKGKRWKEWMSKDAQLRAMRGWKNLKGRMDIGGWNARPVVMIRDDGRLFIFPSIKAAGMKTGVQSRNINAVCQKKRRHAGGFRWFYESDNEWLDLIKR